jgi:hypothetical protein
MRLHKLDEADPEELGFPLGTLDSDPAMKGEMHFCVGLKAPWVEIDDALPRSLDGQPFGSRG